MTQKHESPKVLSQDGRIELDRIMQMLDNRHAQTGDEAAFLLRLHNDLEGLKKILTEP